MFKKKSEKKPYDKTNKAVLRCSICTGEQVAGFKDLETGHFEEIMLIKDSKDLDEFMDTYDVTAITKEYWCNILYSYERGLELIEINI